MVDCSPRRPRCSGSIVTVGRGMIRQPLPLMVAGMLHGPSKFVERVEPIAYAGAARRLCRWRHGMTGWADPWIGRTIVGCVALLAVPTASPAPSGQKVATPSSQLGQLGGPFRTNERAERA
jgi:hypothetical protein